MVRSDFIYISSCWKRFYKRCWQFVKPLIHRCWGRLSICHCNQCNHQSNRWSNPWSTMCHNLSIACRNCCYIHLMALLHSEVAEPHCSTQQHPRWAEPLLPPSWRTLASIGVLRLCSYSLPFPAVRFLRYWTMQIYDIWILIRQQLCSTLFYKV